MGEVVYEWEKFDGTREHATRLGLLELLDGDGKHQGWLSPGLDGRSFYSVEVGRSCLAYRDSLAAKSLDELDGDAAYATDSLNVFAGPSEVDGSDIKARNDQVGTRDDEGYCERAYSADDLRRLSRGLSTIADWLDARAGVKP